MKRFSEFFASEQQRLEALATITEPSLSVDAIARRAESQGGLETEDAASLLAWGRQPSAREEIHAAAKGLRERLAGKTVEFVIPEYLTSFCQNDCLYCGYRKTNPLAERVRLSLEHYERELDLILSWGHRQIELVLADDAEFGPGQLAPYIALTHRKLQALGEGQVALNAPAYEESDYRRLGDAGVDWVALWQETYHQPHFDRWHFPGSRKRHFEFRLDVWDRAIAAGIKRVALGVLFGLYDWRFDVLALVEHGNYLRRAYGIEPHALGIPRLKPARGVLASQKTSRFTVADDDYRLAVSVYQLAFPRTRLFFNTRETYEFNMSMAAGGNLFTADCETLPGAYLHGRLPGQFSTHAYPPRAEVAERFESMGFTCLYLAPVSAIPPSDKTGSAEPIEERDFDTDRWSGEHQEIRGRLDEWENVLARLPSIPASERQTAAWALRNLLGHFVTMVVEHCRREEKALFATIKDRIEDQSRVTELLRDHERFGIDLDKFARQVTSYELSGDPTVLLTLGGRIIREFRGHLDREDDLFGTNRVAETGHDSGVACE
ncbi:MAG TPA: hemerythrin domain-containing protein [Terriglobia bacterium]|nr:hemerythrin domain-containing protein [Terriglobia bacterium]